MATAPDNTIQHFTHPNHLLYRVNHDTEYICNGCHTEGGGSGTTYRCNFCNFNLHEYCATCPRTLSSFMHPRHPLNLLVRTPEDSLQNSSRCCDVCRENIGALFYRCNDCEFDVHPVCTQFPQQLRHVLHPNHPLTLQPSSSGWCMVCLKECSSWRYRCGICCFDIHFECVSYFCEASTSTSGSVLKSHPPPAPPYFGGYGPYGYGSVQVPYFGGYGPYGYGYGCGPSGFSPNYNMYHHNYMHHYYGGEVGRPTASGFYKRIIYQIVGSLTAGTIANVVFGV